MEFVELPKFISIIFLYYQKTIKLHYANIFHAFPIKMKKFVMVTDLSGTFPKVPKNRFSEFSPVFGFLNHNQADLAKIMGVDLSTILGWSQSNAELPPLQLAYLARIEKIISHGEQVFGSKEKFRDWLFSDNLSLAYKKPVELLTDPVALDLVEEAIDALEWGKFV